jgi:nucleotide-binding universal stress UspA family protein
MYMERERKDQVTLLCVHSPPVSDEWVAYTNYIGGLLDSRPVYQGLMPAGDRHGPTPVLESGEAALRPAPWPTAGDQAGYRGDSAVIRPSDSALFIMDDSRPSWWQRLLRRAPASRILQQTPGSILFARHPRRPLRHILVVVRAHASDDLSLTWAERLALPSEAKVTLLPIVPPYPRLHQHDSKIQALDVLMAPNTISGEALHRYARRLDQRGIHGTVCWQQGPPEHQIHCETRATGHDLIVIAGEPFGRFSRWFLGELVGSLLVTADRPVLVAR